MQVTSLAENLSEMLRQLRVEVEAAWKQGRMTEHEWRALEWKLMRIQNQARLLNLMQVTGIRLIRTGKANKNLITEIKALEREAAQNGQGESRLLDFQAAYEKKQHSVGEDGGDAA